METVKNKLSDAEKGRASGMNENPEGCVRVVFIGNSITFHTAAPHIGWYNEWGMAASAAEKDYVHIVTAGIEKKMGKKADVRVRNLADFERDFANYDHSKNQDLIDFRPDILIVALGENLPAMKTLEEQKACGDAFRKLLEGFMNSDKQPKTVIRGVFWQYVWKEQMMREIARDYGAAFAKGDFGGDDSMKALGLFEDRGVQVHPGDKGMAAIAESIISALFEE